MSSSNAEEITYDNGVVCSQHTPRAGGIFDVAGDLFQNRFVIDTPIDGFGKPSIYLSLLRQICSNGAIAHAPAVRSELSLGRGEDGSGEEVGEEAGHPLSLAGLLPPVAKERHVDAHEPVLPGLSVSFSLFAAPGTTRRPAGLESSSFPDCVEWLQQELTQSRYKG